MPCRTFPRLRRTVAVCAAAVAVTAPLLAQVPAAAGETSTRVVGRDISWPNCPEGMGIPGRRSEGLPMPSAASDFVVVGLTNGPGFYPNPCITRQVRWVRKHDVYAAAYSVVTYPTPGQRHRYGNDGPHKHVTLAGKLWNTGYAQAEFNVATMEDVGLTSPIVWVDVEPVSVAPWSKRRARNAAVVRGVVTGFEDAGYRVGFYSTQALWDQIVGDLSFRYPEWRTAGQTSRSSALYKCDHDGIQGGRAVVAQWWTSQRDFDVMCPGYGKRDKMKRFFHKY